jgi:hypothetical protein
LKVARTYELRDHGGPKPTWRPSNGIVKGREPLARSVRRETNRQIKKQRLIFI